MAILDALARFSNAQAVTVDALGTDVYDMGNVTPKRDIFAGVPMAVVFSIGVAAVGTGTYNFQVIVSDNADLSSPTVIASRTVAPAALTAGSQVVVPIPPGAITTQRYLGVNYDTGGTTPGVTASAYLTYQEGADVYRVYDSGFDIT
jgi:hypothetical protein